jgi:hypothetical protein
MPTFHVELWPDLPAPNPPAVDVEADDPMRAAALALGHFARIGVSPAIDGTVQVDDRTLFPDHVTRWLTDDPAGRAFAAAHGLTGLSAG